MKKLGIFLATFLMTSAVIAQTSISDISATWNDGGTDFDAMKMTVTDTASGAGSNLIDFTASTGGSFVIDKSGNLAITGSATIGAYTLPATDGTADYYLKTDGLGGVTWAAVSGGIAAVVDDTTPQLGGSLDLNGFDIVAVAPSSDVATADRTVEGQSAFAAATVNQTASNLNLKMGDHATGGGTAGLVRILAPDDSVAFSIDEDGDLAGKTFIADLTNGNYAYGSGALDSVTTGAGLQNVAMGTNAATALTTGDFSVYLGHQAGMGVIGDSRNTIIGAYAMDGGNSSDNTIIGYQAATSLNGSDDENTVIGVNALYASTSTDAAVIVGYNAVATGNATNAVVLGAHAAPSGVGQGGIIIGYDATPSDSANPQYIHIGSIAAAVPPIAGFGGAFVDQDFSAKVLTITGPSALPTATTNQDGGNLVLQGGQKATGGGSNGLTLVNDTVYGMIYVTANGTAETTVDSTPRKIAAFDSDGPENGVDADHTSDDITCDTAGTYKISASVSFSGTLSSTYNVEIYKNTTGTGFVLERKLGTGGDIGNSAVMGIVNCAATDTFSLYQYTADGSAMTIHAAQLTAHRLSQ